MELVNNGAKVKPLKYRLLRVMVFAILGEAAGTRCSSTNLRTIFVLSTLPPMAWPKAPGQVWTSILLLDYQHIAARLAFADSTKTYVCVCGLCNEAPDYEGIKTKGCELQGAFVLIVRDRATNTNTCKIKINKKLAHRKLLASNTLSKDLREAAWFGDHWIQETWF